MLFLSKVFIAVSSNSDFKPKLYFMSHSLKEHGFLFKEMAVRFIKPIQMKSHVKKYTIYVKTGLILQIRIN